MSRNNDLKIGKKKTVLSPDCCGSMGWASSRKTKGCRFNSWSGHTPRLWAQSPVRACVRGNQSMFLSLSFSLPALLSKNK